MVFSRLLNSEKANNAADHKAHEVERVRLLVETAERGRFEHELALLQFHR